MKRLIVNADDFGMAESVNVGIVKGHKEGVVTSASLVAGGAAAEHAAALAEENPGLGVGAHLCLTRIPALTKIKTPGSPLEFMLRYVSGAIRNAEVEAELRAQVERVLSLGIKPTHIDGHQHLFVMPGIFPIALSIAKEYGIGAMRFPVGPWRGGMGIPKTFEKFMLENIAGMQNGRLAASGVRRPDYFFGLAETGRLDADSLLRIMEGLPDGTSEIMCHPGLANAKLAKEINWGFNWERELGAVTDPRVKEAVRRMDIDLINFGGLL